MRGKSGKTMTETAPVHEDTPSQKGILGAIERAGNALPDPVMIFAYLFIAFAVISQLAVWSGFSAVHPVNTLADGSPEILLTQSVFSADSIQHLLVEMPDIFTGFHPLGYVLVVMLGAGVAERAGLFGAAMRSMVRGAPKFLLTPAVALTAMIANLAADAAYVVLIPLAGVIYAAAGRHPIVGITAAFAGVSGGFSANLFPGQLDALLFGVTEAAVVASELDPGWTMNILGNWYFIAGMAVIYTPVIWFVADAVLEPRLGKWTGGASPADAADEDDDPNAPLTAAQKKGLARAGWVLLAVAFIWTFLTFDLVELVSFGALNIYGGKAPLFDETPGLEIAQALTPLFSSLVAGFMVLFLAAGVAYGTAAGTIKSHRDTVEMMAAGMRDMGYYLVLAFAAAYFVELFNQSRLGLILAVHGANGLEASGLPLPILLGLIVVLAGLLNLFVGSASAKWALLAPVLVPMLMLLGVSPEMATAAYRVGDSGTNIITPLMVYFPLVLVFCRRWVPGFGLGSLTAAMIPYSLWIMAAGIAMTIAWVYLGWPLGPGAEVRYAVPGAGG